MRTTPETTPETTLQTSTDRPTDRPQACPQALSVPRLGDQAVVQIHDFLHHLLDLFEAHYGDQLRRFYEDLHDPCFDDDLTEAPDDLPF